MHRAVLGELGVAVAGSCCGIDFGENVAAGVEAGLAIPKDSVQILKSGSDTGLQNGICVVCFLFLELWTDETFHCSLLRRLRER